MKAIRFILLPVLLFKLSIEITWGQNLSISDSMHTLVESAQTSDRKIDHLLKWCKIKRYDAGADSVINKAIRLISSTNNDSLIGQIWAAQAQILRRQSLYDSAAEYNKKAFLSFKKSEAYAEQIIQLSQLAYREIYVNDNGSKSDSLYQLAEEIAGKYSPEDKIMLRIFQGRAVAKSFQFKYDEAIDFALKAEQYLDTTDHRWYKSFYHNLGHIYDVMGNDEAALRSYGKVLNKSKSLNDLDGVAFSSRSTAAILMRQDRYKEAEELFLNAVAAFDTLGNEARKAWTIAEMAQMYGKMGELEKSYEASRYALNYARKYKIKNEEAWTLAMIGFYYLKTNRPTLALQNCREAWQIVLSIENKGTKMNTCECLVNSYEALGNYRKALEYNRIYHALADSSSGNKQAKEIAQIESKYQLEKAEQRALLEQEKQQLEYESKLTRQSSVRNLILLGTLGLVILLAFFWRNNRRRKKTNALLAEKNGIIQNALDEKNLLLREIHHRVKNNLQVISSLLALQSRYIADDNALSALKEGQDRVQSMALIHQDLYQADNLKGVDTQQYFEQLIESLYDSYHIDEDTIRLEFEVDPINLDVDTMIPLGLILNELVSNSLKHAFKDSKVGTISIKFKDLGDHLLLHVSDDGKGLEPSEETEGKSFGFELIKAFAEKLNADMHVMTDKGFGVKLEIYEFVKAA